MDKNIGYSNKEFIIGLPVLFVFYLIILIFVDHLEKNRIQKSEELRLQASLDNPPDDESIMPEEYYSYNFFNDKELFPIKFDPLKVQGKNIDSFILDKETDIQLSVAELKRQLKEYSYKLKGDFCIWNEQEVYTAIYRYNKLKHIPYLVIKKILPKSERQNQLVIETKIRRTGDPVKGEDRDYKVYSKIEKIYSMQELVNHIQLVVLGYGKSFPTIQLITLKKDNLEYIDQTILYSMEINDNEIIRIKGCLNATFDTLHTWYINEIGAVLDTTKYSHEISGSGQIKRKQNH